MKQLFLLLLTAGVLLAYCNPVVASWATVPEETLVEQAELIVQGIVDRTETGFSIGGRDYQFVVIDVSDVLKGDTENEVRILQPAPNLLAASSDIRFKVGQAGAWLLNREPLLQDEFFVSYPSQYQPGGIVVGPPQNTLLALGVPEPSSLALATLALWGLRLLGNRRSVRQLPR